MLRIIKHIFLKLFSRKYRQYLSIQEEIGSRFGSEVASKMKFDKKGFAVVPDAKGHLKKQFEKEAKEHKKAIPRSEILCKQCFKPMSVSIGQICETHRACRKDYRQSKRARFA